MGTAMIDQDRSYWTAGRIKRELRVNDHWLLRAVAIGRVRVFVADGISPRYCADDVRAFLNEITTDDRQRKGRRIVPASTVKSEEKTETARDEV
jgi:hypothetical protein